MQTSVAKKGQNLGGLLQHNLQEPAIGAGPERLHQLLPATEPHLAQPIQQPNPQEKHL